MKTESINHVPVREIRRALANIVADEGGMREAGKNVGVTHSMVSYVLTGKVAPGPKFLKRFNLKRMVIYVRDDESQGK